MSRNSRILSFLLIGIVLIALYVTATFNPALLISILLVVFAVTTLVIILILWSTNPRKFRRLEQTNEAGDTTVYFYQWKAVYYQLYEKAIAELQQGNNDTAKQLLDKFMYLEPNNPLAYIGFGLYYRNDDIVSAEKHFRTAHDLDPKLLLPLTWLSIVAYQRTNFHEAIEYFERAVKLNRKLPEPYLGLARCYEQLNNIPNALRYFEQFVQIAPQSTEAPKIRHRIDELSKDAASRGS